MGVISVTVIAVLLFVVGFILVIFDNIPKLISVGLMVIGCLTISVVTEVYIVYLTCNKPKSELDLLLAENEILVEDVEMGKEPSSENTPLIPKPNPKNSIPNKMSVKDRISSYQNS